MTGSVNLNTLPGMTAGSIHTLHVFHAERYCCRSTFQITTTICFGPIFFFFPIFHLLWLLLTDSINIEQIFALEVFAESRKRPVNNAQHLCAKQMSVFTTRRREAPSTKDGLFEALTQTALKLIFHLEALAIWTTITALSIVAERVFASSPASISATQPRVRLPLPPPLAQRVPLPPLPPLELLALLQRPQLLELPARPAIPLPLELLEPLALLQRPQLLELPAQHKRAVPGSLQREVNRHQRAVERKRATLPPQR